MGGWSSALGVACAILLSGCVGEGPGTPAEDLGNASSESDPEAIPFPSPSPAAPIQSNRSDAGMTQPPRPAPGNLTIDSTMGAWAYLRFVVPKEVDGSYRLNVSIEAASEPGWRLATSGAQIFEDGEPGFVFAGFMPETGDVSVAANAGSGRERAAVGFVALPGYIWITFDGDYSDHAGRELGFVAWTSHGAGQAAINFTSSGGEGVELEVMQGSGTVAARAADFEGAAIEVSALLPIATAATSASSTWATPCGFTGAFAAGTGSGAAASKLWYSNSDGERSDSTAVMTAVTGLVVENGTPRPGAWLPGWILSSPAQEWSFGVDGALMGGAGVSIFLHFAPFHPAHLPEARLGRC